MNDKMNDEQIKDIDEKFPSIEIDASPEEVEGSIITYIRTSGKFEEASVVKFLYDLNAEEPFADCCVGLLFNEVCLDAIKTLVCENKQNHQEPSQSCES